MLFIFLFYHPGQGLRISHKIKAQHKAEFSGDTIRLKHFLSVPQTKRIEKGYERMCFLGYMLIFADA